jgi:hypothetical protein
MEKSVGKSQVNATDRQEWPSKHASTRDLNERTEIKHEALIQVLHLALNGIGLVGKRRERTNPHSLHPFLVFFLLLFFIHAF